MDQSCGTESPLYRCFRDTWIWQVSDICGHICRQPCGTNSPLYRCFRPTRRMADFCLLASSNLGRDRPHCRSERGIAPFRRGKPHRSSAVLRSVAVSAKCITIANSGFSGGAVRSTTGCFGDGGGEEDMTKVELLGHQSHWFAFFGKPGRCTRTTQKRCPVGACITTHRSRRSTTCAPSFSRRATSAGISSVSISKCTRLS